MPMKGLRRNDDAMKNKCWLRPLFSFTPSGLFVIVIIFSTNLLTLRGRELCIADSKPQPLSRVKSLP